MPKPYFEDKDKKIQEIIMVDHAGEYGAQRIYAGQLKYTNVPAEKKMIKHMLDQELEHLEYFENKIKAGKSKPTALLPLWDIFGYGFGAISAKLGSKTAMLVTENVEEVIVEHYQEQIDYLEKTGKDAPLLQKIKKFKQDEADHINIALDHESKNAKFNKPLSALVQAICKSAIFLSKRI
ncbi:MAG: ubiquinone biosynthesis protein UbiB [Rickettsiales bacterium]|nr:MAG: ubiquinone biosynthesis protein UbiB [Rickettsiales bacterium]